MVADNVRHGGVIHCAVKVSKEEEAFIPFRIFGLLFYRQHSVQLAGNSQRIDHDIFCRARMDVLPLNFDFSACSVKVFVLQLADFSAVDGIRKIRTEFYYIEEVCTSADFLIGGKADFNRTMLHLRVVAEVFNHPHDDGDARFIIRTQKRGAVSGDNVFADKFVEERKFLYRQRIGLVQFNIAACVVHNFRIDTFSVQVGRGIHVCNKSDNRRFFIGVGRDCSVDISVRILFGIGYAQLVQFLH